MYYVCLAPSMGLTGTRHSTHLDFKLFTLDLFLIGFHHVANVSCLEISSAMCYKLLPFNNNIDKQTKYNPKKHSFNE